MILRMLILVVIKKFGIQVSLEKRRRLKICTGIDGMKSCGTLCQNLVIW